MQWRVRAWFFVLALSCVCVCVCHVCVCLCVCVFSATSGHPCRYFKDALLSTFMSGTPADMVVRSTSAEHELLLERQRRSAAVPANHAPLRRNTTDLSSSSSSSASPSSERRHVFRGLPSASYAVLVDLLKTQLEAVDDEIDRQSTALSRAEAGRGAAAAPAPAPAPAPAAPAAARPRALSAVEDQLLRKHDDIEQQLDFVRSLSKVVDELVFHAPKVRFECSRVHARVAADRFTRVHG